MTPVAARTSREFRSAIVGRQPELDSLRGFLERTRQRDGGVVFITGEAGVGKTRLAEEAAGSAEREGLSVLTVACQDQDRGIPYAPWTRLLRQYVHRSPRTEVFRSAGPFVVALQQLAPELAEKVWLHDPAARTGGESEAVDGGDRTAVLAVTDAPPDTETPALLGQQVEYQRHRFHAAVAGFFRSAAERQGLLLCLDDVGWADGASLELLEAVARVGRGAALGVIGTYRDTHLDENPALQNILLRLERERWTTRLLVAPLPAAEYATFLGLLLQRPRVDGDLCELLFAKTRGNPFYTMEILQDLADGGTLVRSGAGWEWSRSVEIRLPATVGGTIGARLGRLDDPGRRILRVAALLGQEFSHDLLRTISEEPAERVVAALDDAVGARLVRERSSPGSGVTHEFAHPLIQEVLAKEVSLLRAQILHLRAAQVLEATLGPAAPSKAAALAFHYLHGNDPEHALRYSIAAGDESARVFARAEAAAHYRTALELLPQPADPLLSASLKERLADQLRSLADVPQAAGLYVEAADLWEGLGHRSSAGDCLRRAADCWLGPSEQGIGLLERARGLFEGEPASRSLIRWHLSWSAAINDLGRIEEADREAHQALDLARRLGDPGCEAAALLRLGYTVPLDRRADCLALNAEAARIVEREHLVDQEGALIVSEAVAAYHIVGDLPECRVFVERAIGIAHRVADTEYEHWWQGFAMPWLAVRSGDFRLGREFVEERRRRYRHLSLTGWAPDVEAIGVRAWLALLTGPVDEAVGLLDEAFEAERRRPVWRAQAFNLQFRGRLRRFQGDLPGAIEAFEQACDVYRKAGPPAWHAFLFAETLRLLVDTLLEEGEGARAKERAAELVALAEQFDSGPVRAFAGCARAVSRLDGDGPATALRWLAESRTLWERLGWRYDLALTWEETGDVQASGGALEDARRSYGEAAARLQELGALPDLGRIERKRERLDADGPPAAARGSGRRARSGGKPGSRRA